MACLPLCRSAVTAMLSATAAVIAMPATGSAKADTGAIDGRIAQQGRWFVDSEGRVVTFHGGNVTLPAFDAAGHDARFGPETPARMAEQGFNGVRLVVFLSDIMPRAGVIDEAYLDRIARAVEQYKTAGIRTLIDFHQDEYSAVVGVRGMPAWAVFTDGHTRMAGIEFPVGYFRDPAVQHAFDNFWANHPVAGTGKGVQDLYIEGLAAVARRFAAEPAVLGMDVMNEPATGTRCAQPDPVSANCPELETELLAPFYAKAAAAIHAAAPGMIVFTEPFMLQGALGTPIATPIAGPPGRRALSFHNYGPVKATRDRVNDGALAHVKASGAAIINTEWGFNNDPAMITGQADDFDARQISWLAWTRGAFEALVDPALPDEGNGNRPALLRAYARPYAETTAGTPLETRFDGKSGTLEYRYSTRLPSGRNASGKLTLIRIPAIQYPRGYTIRISGGEAVSRPDAPLALVKASRGAAHVDVTIMRKGDLPPLPSPAPEADPVLEALRALPPIPDEPLNRKSLLGHIYATPGGREVLDREVPGMLTGLSHVHGWEKMTLEGISPFAPKVLDNTRIAAIEADLARLDVHPGPIRPANSNALSLDSLVSDLLADSRARAILEREAPGLIGSKQQGLYPQTTLRHLQPAMPDVLTDDVLSRIAADLREAR